MTISPSLLDADYRAMVRDAVGDEYLGTMTRECLAVVAAMLAERPAAGEALRSRAHRMAGGTATAGLPGMAAALKALEKACEMPGDAPGWDDLLAASDEALRQAYAALAAEAASSFSSR